MRCIRTSSYRASANLPFERPRRNGGQVQWRSAGIMAAIGIVALLGIVMLPDRDDADSAAAIQIAQAPQSR